MFFFESLKSFGLIQDLWDSKKKKHVQFPQPQRIGILSWMEDEF
jgi:hypothetical protein